LVLQYHSGDKYATKATEAKIAESGAPGFPTMLLDGGLGSNVVVGGSSGTLNQYKALIQAELLKPKTVDLAGTMGISSGISIEVSVANLAATDLNSTSLNAVIYEDLGVEQHHFVVQDILPPLSISALAPQTPQQFKFKSDLTGNLSGKTAVIFLKSRSGEVLQAFQISPKP
jgi:hypothetical protein